MRGCVGEGREVWTVHVDGERGHWMSPSGSESIGCLDQSVGKVGR